MNTLTFINSDNFDDAVTSSGNNEEQYGQFISIVQGQDSELYVHYNNATGITRFGGACRGEHFFHHLIGDYYGLLKDTLVQAINNRTRERNYFRLYSELLEDSITEEEFNEELQRNRDEYIIKLQHKPSFEELMVALNASKDIMDITSIEDMQTAFSFAPKELKNLLDK